MTDQPKRRRASPAPRTDSKTATIIGMLKRDGGATTEQLVAYTGWAPSTVRAFLATLKTKKGHAITSEKVPSTITYRIAGEDEEVVV